jgi:hypothetical protein
MADPSPVLSSQINGSEYYTDDPLCGCTIVDKDHEATITTLGLANYFELLHRQVCCWAELICFYLPELLTTRYSK